MSDSEFIQALYRGAFGPDADPEGLQHHLDSLARGVSRAAVAAEFTESREAVAHQAASGGTGGTTTPPGPGPEGLPADTVAASPTLHAGSGAGHEDTPITLPITAALTDPEGSETLVIRISGVPAGATLSAGTAQGGGVYILTPDQLANLTITSAPNFSGSFDLTVVAISTESSNGATAQSAPETINITVHPVADGPSFPASGGTGTEDTAIPLTLVTLLDGDGSEAITTVTVSGVPVGASLSAGTNNGGGTWTLNGADLIGLTLTPPTDFAGTIQLTVTATTEEGATGGQFTSGPTAVAVQVNPAADIPNLSVGAASGNEDGPIALAITASAADTDGSETVTVTVSDLPTGATLSAGNPLGGGAYELTLAQLNNLSINPPSNFSGTLQPDGHGDEYRRRHGRRRISPLSQ